IRTNEKTDTKKLDKSAAHRENSKKTKESKTKEKELAATEKSKQNDLNQYIGIAPVSSTALTGADANFTLTLKLTGAKRIYENVDVQIDLPITEYITFNSDQEELDSLAIDGVSPTFNSETNQLIYHFDEIKRGQMYERMISLHTKNGYILNDTAINVSAHISGEVHYTENDEKEEAQKGDIVSFNYKDKASMNLKASGGLSLSKSHVDAKGVPIPNDSVVSRGEKILWKLTLKIPKKQRGQLFLKPGEKITITDTLPTQIQYNSVTSGDKPTKVEGQKITWEFDAEDLETQNKKDQSLYEKEIIISTTVKNNAAEGTVTNNAEASAVFIENSKVISRANESVFIAVGDPSGGNIQGSTYVPNHFGPGGEAGNHNPRPYVTDDALLEFRHGIAPLPESFPDRKGENLGRAKNFQDYRTIYEIDQNLNLEEFRAPGKFMFRPNAQHPVGNYFATQPQYRISAKLNGSDSLQVLVAADEVIHGKWYTREELGLKPSDKVNEIRIVFVNGYKGKQNEVAPGGMLAGQLPRYKFSIKKGFIGQVENKFNVT